MLKFVVGISINFQQKSCLMNLRNLLRILLTSAYSIQTKLGMFSTFCKKRSPFLRMHNSQIAYFTSLRAKCQEVQDSIFNTESQKGHKFQIYYLDDKLNRVYVLERKYLSINFMQQGCKIGLAKTMINYKNDELFYETIEYFPRLNNFQTAAGIPSSK